MTRIDFTAVEHLLVDSRLGVITTLRPYAPGPRTPAGWVGWSAYTGDSSEFASWQGERYGFGAAIHDDERARRAAVGEAIERYCGNAVPQDLRRASFTDLARVGHTALDPTKLSLYADIQYHASGFPFVPFAPDLTVSWVEGRNLMTGEPTLVPASMVYLNYYQGAHENEAPTNALLYAGIATGENREHAERFAIEELIERDANTIWWAAGGQHTEIAGADHLLQSVHPSIRVRLLLIPSEIDVPVVAAFLEDTADRLISYGTACRASPEEAARKALVEAIGMLELTAELDDPGSAYWHSVRAGAIPSRALHPHRADRGYAQHFRSDYRDLTDLPAVAQLYLDPAMQGQPLDRLRSTPFRCDLSTMSAIEPKRARAEYLRLLAAAGMAAFSVDITTSDVRASGLRVVRVVVPGLYCNPPAAFPYLGGTRLYETPARLGFSGRVLTADDFYPHPIPHV